LTLSYTFIFVTNVSIDRLSKQQLGVAISLQDILSKKRHLCVLIQSYLI